jgi:hypothetical protein
MTDLSVINEAVSAEEIIQSPMRWEDDHELRVRFCKEVVVAHFKVQQRQGG